ncbi:hypothetical protein GL263_08670 [Streptomyces durbertensis]|uniref:Lipoprotein n=1 Tax=Streptomyces durbertensis TaxID=2448886 RepID=A0ABR6EEW9_9ACTN|nr:hypothetical protein [Streptomyces durbertensis]MBB1243632.1 hypothetical protein [Streptomyces durbertensis]
MTTRPARRAAVRRAVTAALLGAVTAFTALTATGCGGSPEPEPPAASPRQPTEDGTVAPEATEWPKEPARGELTDDQLARYALAQGDLPGFRVRIPSEQELDGMGKEKAEQAECQPLVGLMAGEPEPRPSARVYRTIHPTADAHDPSGLILFGTLAAYDKRGAEALFRDLRRAIERCADGFETTAKEGLAAYTEVKELPRPETGGADDALAYQLVGDADGQKLPVLFNVLRVDSTVAVYYSMNLLEPGKAVIPEAVVRTQTEKLTAE